MQICAKVSKLNVNLRDSSSTRLFVLSLDKSIPKHLIIAMFHYLLSLCRLFNRTRVGALGPLNAAQAYQRIVDALTNAEQAARNASLAANKAFQVVSWHWATAVGSLLRNYFLNEKIFY